MKSVIISSKKEEAPNITQFLGTFPFIQEDFPTITRITIPIPDEELDALLSKIQEALRFMDKSTLVEVYSPEFVISRQIDEAKEAKTEKKKGARTAVEKLLDSAESQARPNWDTLMFAIIGTEVALMGLFINSIGVIIGTMLISPLLGPISAFAVTTSAGYTRLVISSIRTLMIYIFAIIIIAFVTTFILSLFMELPITPEILSRTSSSPIYVAMAVMLGIAAIIALSKEIPDAISGVAIGAALLPPAVVLGITGAIYPAGVVGAFLLTFENIVGLMIGSCLGALVLRIVPRGYREQIAARKIIGRTLIVLVILIMALLALVLLT
jgi:uncharacterized hydrophobic protein (TIGR00341 family)